MMNINPEQIFAIIITTIFGLSILGKLIPKREPKEKTFLCCRCKTVSKHNQRTIEAWRNKKTKFFCQVCHAKWLQSQPLQNKRNNSSNSGCLGVVLLFTVIPLASYFLARALFSSHFPREILGAWRNST
jgi:hypothetical protein